MKEITFEITDYCPHRCEFCSSNAVDDIGSAVFLDIFKIKEILKEKFDIINISGGEPLSHPDFYNILQICKASARIVNIYTNEITHITFNPRVIDRIVVECNLTITDDVERVHILRRVKHGREKTRPEVHFSRNWTEECSCEHVLIKPDGSFRKSPCKKEEFIHPDG